MSSNKYAKKDPKGCNQFLGKKQYKAKPMIHDKECDCEDCLWLKEAICCSCGKKNNDCQCGVGG